ncbi:MAG: prepilin-type N-terminal cleavage/methylation domain-containing protein [Armatimonadota bacterium]
MPTLAAPRSARKPSDCTRCKSSGFTLIELLVVIAIIAILAAILFPVFAQARDKARQTACLSNQKQISNAFQMYAQDYDEVFPYARSTRSGTPANDYTQLLSPYIMKAYGDAIRSAAVYTCPNDSTERRVYSMGINTPNSYAAVYGWDNDPRLAAFQWEDGSFIAGRAMAEFPAPASTLLLAEKPSIANVVGQNNSWVFRPSNNLGQDCISENDWGTCSAAETIKPRHAGGWNYMFVDGHVKWYRPEATVDSNPGDAYTGTTNDTPRGMWTLDPND